jgi:hypothetical protein
MEEDGGGVRRKAGGRAEVAPSPVQRPTSSPSLLVSSTFGDRCLHRRASLRLLGACVSWVSLPPFLARIDSTSISCIDHDADSFLLLQARVERRGDEGFLDGAWTRWVSFFFPFCLLFFVSLGVLWVWRMVLGIRTVAAFDNTTSEAACMSSFLLQACARPREHYALGRGRCGNVRSRSALHATSVHALAPLSPFSGVLGLGRRRGGRLEIVGLLKVGDCNARCTLPRSATSTSGAGADALRARRAPFFLPDARHVSGTPGRAPTSSPTCSYPPFFPSRPFPPHRC